MMGFTPNGSSHGGHSQASTLRSMSSPKGRLLTLSLVLLFLIITKFGTFTIRSRLNGEDEYSGKTSFESFLQTRNNCQIVYVLGVEGSVHHGFTPILEALAKKQVDAETGQPYDVAYSEGHLRTAMFGFHGESRTITDPKVVKRTFKKMCPDDGRKHIIIEDASFPSGSEDDPRTYRVHRQTWWKDANMEEIATSDSALNHPTNLYSFYKEYSPQANIKFVVLHRSYIETIASHFDFDGTAMQHSNVIRGFLLLLRRFLDSHTLDTYTGERLWTLVCVDRMMGKVHEGNDESLQATRQRIVDYLADFLGWERSDCAGCFEHWRSSRKNHLTILGEENVNIVLAHMRGMGGVWPPVVQDALSDQKCSL